MNLIGPLQRLLLLLVACSYVSILSAQTPFFSEEFKEDPISKGWATRNLNGSPQAIWTWCADHVTSDNPPIGCPLVFDDLINQQGPFQSTTADSGFVAFDSDYYFFEGIADRHNSVLTTPLIDCTDKEKVWLKFESQIGVFNRETRDNALIEVSTDEISWEPFPVVNIRPLSFGDLDPGITGWSLNPEITVIDISDVAANQETVWIRWRWDGEAEYYWAMDDVGLYEEDPSALFIPQHDLRLTNFFAVSLNLTTPISQVERFGFLADVKNDGLQDQTGVELEVVITYQADNSQVYQETKSVTDIAADELRQNILFDGLGYQPDKKGVYEVTYTVSADSIDNKPENNSKSFTFKVSDNTFAKEDGILSHTVPIGVWEEGVNHSWGWGNYFYCPKALDFIASSVDFSIDGPLSNLADEIIDINLYQWLDINDNGNCELKERFLLNSTPYQITGFNPSDQFINVPLNNGKGVKIDDDGQYIVMLEFNAPNDSDNLQIAFNNRTNYGGQFLRSDLLDQTRHGSLVWIGNPDSTTFISFGFGASFMPCIRLNIDLDVGNNEAAQTLASHQLQLSPNPVRKDLQVSVQLDKVSERMALSIWDTQGKQQKEWHYKNVRKQQVQIPVDQLAAGIYLLRIDTDQGYLTKRFVVQ